MRRLIVGAVTLALATLAVAVPAATASAATACATPWSAATTYLGGDSASHDGHNWTARWWTLNETPGTAEVWTDQGACGDGGGGEEPGAGDFVVTEQQFEQMFPNRNPFYTYSGLTSAMNAYPAFANAGSDTVRRQEAAAFLANVSHETGGLVYVVEQDTSNYPHYCDPNQSYGCPAGTAAYYGRGPIQLSWNFNYYAAGNALGIDLLGNPYLVEQDASVAWMTGLWYWMTQTGPGTMTGHDAMVNGAGFGETIRSINGSLECNGGNPGQVQSRIDRYLSFTSLLGVDPGGNLSC